MDPVTAAILIGMVVSAGTSAYQADQAKKAQKAMQEDQERLRISNVYAEAETTRQKNNIALNGAANKAKAPMAPSFASAALLGNQSSNAAPAGPMTSMGSSGTF